MDRVDQHEPGPLVDDVHGQKISDLVVRPLLGPTIDLLAGAFRVAGKIDLREIGREGGAGAGDLPGRGIFGRLRPEDERGAPARES